MITCDLLGRTGNQAIQICTTIAHAHRLGVEYKIPDHSLNQELWPLLFDQFPKFTIDDHNHIKALYREPADFTFSPIPLQDSIKLHGYWQSDLHFKDYRPEILKAFNIPQQRQHNWVSIHVRRGDYVQLADKHPPVNGTYLFEAMKFFYNKGYNQFLVFSDDIPWCQEFLMNKGENITIKYSTGNDTLGDLYLMSNCEHHIIANSTYSWIAAWLNQNENKIVVSPSKENWFGPGNKHLKTDWIIPSEWHQIKY